MRMAASVITSFFKVILNSTLQEGKMKLPTKFAMELGAELPETVRLCLPSGRCWSVGIERESENAIWLHHGLLKFIEDNSIGIEYFLVFKYDGNSDFGVIIFDLTAAEIQYNCIAASIKRENIDQTFKVETGESENGSGNCARGEAESDDSAIEYLGSSGTNKGSRRPYFTRRRKQDMEGVIISDRTRSMCKLREDGKNSNRYKGKTRNEDTGACAAGITKERIVEPKYKSSPNIFKVTLTSSYIERGDLKVPSDFFKLHMPNSTKFIKLIDAENNEWVVHYIHRGNNNVLTSGWAHFVEEKKLMVGDVCIFERVRGDKEVKLRVTITSSDETNSTMHKDTTRNDGTDVSPIEPVDKSSPNIFKVTLKQCYIRRSYLYVPSDFALLHMSHSTRLIKLVDAEDNEWLVRYIHQGRMNMLSMGWRRFVKDKMLMVGDVCIFERVQGDDEVKLRVTISRSENIDQTSRAESKNGSGNCARGEAESDDSAVEYLGSSRVGVLQGTNKGNRSYFTRRRKQVIEGDIISDRSMRKLREDGKNSNRYKDKTRNDDTGACAAGIRKERIVEPKYKSSPNIFKVTLTSSYIERGVLRVPSDFSKLHMSNSKRFIKLIDAENNEWVVRFIYGGGKSSLCSGWGRFVQEKKLMVGDVCIFKRVRGDGEVKLRVIISRSAKDKSNSTMHKDTRRNDGTDVSPSEPVDKCSPNFFKLTLKRCYVQRCYLYVPSDFALLHMSHSTRLINLVDAENNEWLVRYIHQGHRNLLSSGWRRFVKDKKLMVGDVCIFERVQGEDEVNLRVTVSRSGKHLE